MILTNTVLKVKRDISIWVLLGSGRLNSSEEATVPVTNNKRVRGKTPSQLKLTLSVTTRNFFVPLRTAKEVSEKPIANIDSETPLESRDKTSISVSHHFFVLRVPSLLICWAFSLCLLWDIRNRQGPAGKPAVVKLALGRAMVVWEERDKISWQL
jgi:hypothetical protein